MIELILTLSSVGIGTGSGAVSQLKKMSTDDSKNDELAPSPSLNTAGDVTDTTKIYEEQKRLESADDHSILDVSDDSSGEDPVPEEILLNSSSDAGEEPTKELAIANNSEPALQPASFATNSESADSASMPVAKQSEATANMNATGQQVPDKMDSVPSGAPDPTLPGEYYAIRNARKASRTMPNLHGGYPEACALPGDFYPSGDHRMNIANVVFDMEKKQCISTSFNTDNMSCHCCGSFLCRDTEKYGRQTFVLADQNYPAALPSYTNGAKCMKILRIEGAKLDELVEKFLCITTGWRLPQGCLILIGSLSHLAEAGLAAYTQDLCSAVAKLTEGLRRAANIAPVPFILCETIMDPALIRSIVELYAWIGTCLSSVEGTSASAFRASLEGLNFNGTGLVQPDYTCRHRLPTELGNSNTQIWNSTGLAALPSGVKKFTSEMEEEILSRLISDLNGFLALELDGHPDLERDVDRSDMTPLDDTIFILIGGSHALRTANGLVRRGKRAIAATIGGWKPTADMLAAILAKLGKAVSMCPDKSKIVCVFQMYDNCSYFCQDEEGNRSAAKKGPDGKFHVQGGSVTAHQDIQYQFFKKTIPVLEAVDGVRKIVLSPLPRYWELKCCKNKNHCVNQLEPDYKQKLEGAVYEMKNNLRAQCFRHGQRNTRVLGSWHIVKKEKDLWADAVHLSDGGYNLLADSVIEAAADMTKKRKADMELGADSKRPKSSAGGYSGSVSGHNSHEHGNRRYNYYSGGGGGSSRAPSSGGNGGGRRGGNSGRTSGDVGGSDRDRAGHSGGRYGGGTGWRSGGSGGQYKEGSRGGGGYKKRY